MYDNVPIYNADRTLYNPNVTPTATSNKASQFGWNLMQNGMYSNGYRTISASEMNSMLPKLDFIQNQSTNQASSGVNFLNSIQPYLDENSQPNEYESSLKSLMENPDSIKDTGAYKFSFDQGKEAVERSAAAKGMLGSGNVLAELTQFGNGLASQQYNNEANRLAGLASTQKNYLMGKGQLALGAAKAQSDDYWTGKNMQNQFALNSGYAKQSSW